MGGFLNVLKPEGITSHDAVLQVRRILGEKRVGHLGTLDPMAVGVLPMVLGRYTRLSEYLLDEDKEYLAEFAFGITTDTCDLDGRITSRVPCEGLAPPDIVRFLAKYTGKIKQVPPAYSAVHVKGRRLHELARKGVEVEAPERDVEVYEFKLLSWKPDPSPRGIFRLRVGRGTYVRALARDLGKDLGCGAAVSYLLRSRVGGFTLKNAVPLAAMRRMQRSTRPHPSRPTSEYAPRIAGGLLSDPATVLSGFPLFELRRDSLASVVHGRPLKPWDFTDPGKVEEWLWQAAAAQGKPRVCFAMYRDAGSGRSEVACVLSAVPGAGNIQGNSCRVKYEKVLLPRER
ncbi:MAG: tRNA pseudouridine(55) synthase TruB [Bacillota bacterium]|jgi:tRNA pseudouridine55 synthase|nr:tRNA pseudouridine(55) synthase TruB [Candidatus Fermentithermobacillaceae bacterium]